MTLTRWIIVVPRGWSLVMTSLGWQYGPSLFARLGYISGRLLRVEVIR